MPVHKLLPRNIKCWKDFSSTIASALNASASAVDSARPIQLFSSPSLINKILTLTRLAYFSPLTQPARPTTLFAPILAGKSMHIDKLFAV